jgi:hypothetical protein
MERRKGQSSNGLPNKHTPSRKATRRIRRLCEREGARAMHDSLSIHGGRRRRGADWLPDLWIRVCWNFEASSSGTMIGDGRGCEGARRARRARM